MTTDAPLEPYDWSMDPKGAPPISEATDAILARAKQVYITHDADGLPSMVILFDDQKLPRTPGGKMRMCQEMYDHLMMELMTEYYVCPIGRSASVPYDPITDQNYAALGHFMALPVEGLEASANPEEFPRRSYAIKFDCAVPHTAEKFQQVAAAWQQRVDEHFKATPNIARLFT